MMHVRTSDLLCGGGQLAEASPYFLEKQARANGECDYSNCRQIGGEDDEGGPTAVLPRAPIHQQFPARHRGP